MNPSILSLLPPLLTIFSALITQAILPSLLLGIASATLILSNGNPIAALQLATEKIRLALGLTAPLSPMIIYNSFALMMFIFLLCLGCLIALITHSGGAYAYTSTKNNKHISIKKASLQTLLLAFFLCIDDYFSTLTVGSVMKTITDQARMPRIQLAFIVTSLATTLCAILPFSSWGAEIIGQLTVIGIGTAKKSFLHIEPLYAFLLVIPCILQAWSAIANVITYIFIPVYFGPFYRHRIIAHETHNLWGGKESPHLKISATPNKNKANASSIDFFIPLVILIFVLGLSLYYTGISNSAQALGITGLFTLCSTTALLLIRKKVTIQELPTLYHEGGSLMFSTLFMLTAAWTLTQIVKNDLQTGVYLASIFPRTISPLFFPALSYLSGICMTLGIGSAWASIGLLLGIVLPLAVQILALTTPITPCTAPILFILIGAIVSGSLIGNQISPIADVTVMASNCSGAYHNDFMRAQFWYTVPQIFTVTIAYLILGFLSLHAYLWHHWLIGISSIIFLIALAPWGYIVIQNKRFKA